MTFCKTKTCQKWRISFTYCLFGNTPRSGSRKLLVPCCENLVNLVWVKIEKYLNNISSFVTPMYLTLRSEVKEKYISDFAKIWFDSKLCQNSPFQSTNVTILCTCFKMKKSCWFRFHFLEKTHKSFVWPLQWNTFRWLKN